MWNYEKRLQYPVKIKQSDPTLAKIIITQFGGANHNNLYSIHSRFSNHSSLLFSVQIGIVFK